MDHDARLNDDALSPPGSGALDPEDWDATARLGHRMVDDMLGYLRTVRERPLWRPVPPGVKAAFEAPLPLEPEPAEAVYEAFLRDVLPYPHGNLHPRFWGWVVGTGSPIGMFADLLAAGMNSNSGFGEQAVAFVERQVFAWLREALGLPEGGSGLLVSGCSMANLVGLTLARNVKAGWDVRGEGIAGGPPLRVYGSTQTHSSNHRALEVLGLGRGGFVAIPTGADHRVEVAAMAQRIAADRAAGLRPVAIVGNAGTVNAGAFDDLGALADLAAAEGLWLHVDGAFGALAALSPRHRSLTEGMGRADSVAFDLHKWLHVPYDAGAVLVRDEAAHRGAFSLTGAYLSPLESRLATGPINFMDYGVQMSRGFRALKVWMTLKHHGLDRLGGSIARNIDQAAWLAAQIIDAPDLELCAPVPLNVVCFRYAPEGGPPEGLDALNRRILVELHERGIAAPSHTVLDGRFVLRAAISNHRTHKEDLELLLTEVRALGQRFAPSLGGWGPPGDGSPAHAPPR